MAIQDLPPFYNMKFADESGNLSPEAHLHMDQTFQALNALMELVNRYISDNGIIMPNKTTAQITALEPSASLGTVWFNTTLAKLQVKTASGVVQTITST